MSDASETIVAIASPTTPALRGVVRLSGDEVLPVLQALGVMLPSSNAATAIDATIQAESPIGAVDGRLSLWPTSRSYTGQPSAEFHTYGSQPILAAVLDACVAAGARLARPGEFTMRAFLAGRLDLTQAEAVLGVIDAQQRGSLDHALRQLAGNLSRPLETLRSDLLDLLADVEAGLDFVDEDIQFISDDDLVNRLQSIKAQLVQTQQLMRTRGDADVTTVVSLRGEPNAGKSRLLNRLTDRQVAIVADVAGTTRDAVTAETIIEGHRVKLVDTAGIETQQGEDVDALISQASQVQATRASDEAAVRLWCLDATRSDFHAAADRMRQLAASRRQSAVDLWVATKTDLCDSTNLDPTWIKTSSVAADGIDLLKQAIVSAIAMVDQEETGSVVGTAARCRETLAGAITAIDQAVALTQGQQGHEFVSAELRLAAQCLGEVTGAVYTDDILDRVFGRFCIGK
ncbi:tRNA uridine-5-carboxymethylaminomethyl(34) synthesis GTPase MnmE [Planctomycetes bacterium K23_9]|uniref:tRNA modification GTPase MnmE n=1 Tax=Stieleria marina TaxID=1930275 RepID=A0A517NVP9_9BACT|nr:tRNA modification GTPase MnmE [Planctomycetes bacterium K23_9]